MRLPRFARSPLLTAATCALLLASSAIAARTTWMPDNGNGTYTNPLFYDEFSDPDVIRVGDDFYLAGTTMHAMPCLVVLHSKDLVNWKFLSYATERLDFGPGYRLENDQEIYGQGIWAPCIRYHQGTFYIFSNINGRKTQLFRATNPAGPWTRTELGSSLHDLSVLFDDNGKIYVVWNYSDVMFAELRSDLSDIIPETKRVVIPAGNGMGEGHHFYKINGKYYILSANYAPVGRLQCARADRPDGPYETVVISDRETMGTERGWWVNNAGLGRPVPKAGFKFDISKPAENDFGAVPLHQGGIVDLPNGDWWGYSMADFRSVGRTIFLSPVTWQNGWPYFGLPRNLGRSPRTWIKPAVNNVEPTAPYERSDDFAGAKLKPIWQWNHAPVDAKWSLTEKPGALRLHTLPANDFLWARNSLTQRVIGPESSATVTVDASGLQVGDIAGLGLLNIPCAWIGLARTEGGHVLRWYNQITNQTIDQPLSGPRVDLRVSGNYDTTDLAHFSYAVDGRHFTPIGDEVRLPFQLKTFQGVRYALFAFNSNQRDGGFADFANFQVDEPLADRSNNLPLGKIITLANLANGNLACVHPLGLLHWARPGSKEATSSATRFRVHDRGQGRVALEAMDGSGFVTIVGVGLSGDVRLIKSESDASLFQWQDMLRGQCMLLSLKTQRYVGLDPTTGEPYSADRPGTRPDRKDGTVLTWAEATTN